MGPYSSVSPGSALSGFPHVEEMRSKSGVSLISTVSRMHSRRGSPRIEGGDNWRGLLMNESKRIEDGEGRFVYEKLVKSIGGALIEAMI